MQRIYSLDCLKLLFAYLVAFAHFGAAVPVSGGLVVRLFYIISGFFLARKFCEKKQTGKIEEYTQWHYTADHIKSLYPHYVFSLIMLGLYYVLEKAVTFWRQPSISQLSAIAKDLYGLIPEFFLLQNAGFFGGGINYPLWQVCLLVICGYFIYGLLCANEKLSRDLIFPAAILMIQAFLETDIPPWGIKGFFYVPILRAFSPLCIGVLAYYLTQTAVYQRITISKRWLLDLGSVYALITFFLYKDYNNIFLITFVVVILALYDEKTWLNKLLNKKIFKRFAPFSYAIYLNHALIIEVLDERIFPRLSRMLDCTLTETHKNLLFFIVLTVYSVITLVLVKNTKHFFKKEKAAV